MEAKLGGTRLRPHSGQWRHEEAGGGSFARPLGQQIPPTSARKNDHPGSALLFLYVAAMKGGGLNFDASDDGIAKATAPLRLGTACRDQGSRTSWGTTTAPTSSSSSEQVGCRVSPGPVKMCAGQKSLWGASPPHTVVAPPRTRACRLVQHHQCLRLHEQHFPRG